MAITKDQIFAIADELDAAGKNPTLAAVRTALGAGSFTTISDAMNDWKARKASRETPLREPAPQAVTDKLAEFGAEIWTLGLALANARFAAEREELETARLQIEAEKAEVAEMADHLSTELDASKIRLIALDAAEQSARRDVQQLQMQLTITAERASTAEARTIEIERRADDLNAELKRVNQQNAEMLKALTGDTQAKSVKKEGKLK